MAEQEAADERAEPVIDLAAATVLPPRGEELLRVCVRFEYAVKAIGYFKAGKKRVAEVRWDDFANERLTQTFYQRIVEQQVAPTLMHAPPSRQIVVGPRGDEKLDWETVAPPRSVQELIGCVRRVRNNLAHGGKSGTPDEGRDGPLVAEAIAVLIEALKMDEKLRYAFSGVE